MSVLKNTGCNKAGMIIEPCEFGDICKNMTPDNGRDVLYEVRVLQQKGYYDSTRMWQDTKTNCFAIRTASVQTAKRFATRIAKLFDYVVLVSLWKRTVNPDDQRCKMVPVWRRSKSAAARNFREWESVEL